MHWLQHWSGYDGQGIYDLYSGIFPFLIGLSFIGGLITTYRKHVCHMHGCWRIAHFDADDINGVTRRVCHRHHPNARHIYRLRPHHLGHRRA